MDEEDIELLRERNIAHNKALLLSLGFAEVAIPQRSKPSKAKSRSKPKLKASASGKKSGPTKKTTKRKASEDSEGNEEGEGAKRVKRDATSNVVVASAITADGTRRSTRLKRIDYSNDGESRSSSFTSSATKISTSGSKAYEEELEDDDDEREEGKQRKGHKLGARVANP